MSGDGPTCDVCGFWLRILPGGGYSCPNGHRVVEVTLTVAAIAGTWTKALDGPPKEGPSPTDPPTLTSLPLEKRLTRVRLEYSDGTYRELSGTGAERWGEMVNSVCTLAEIHHFNALNQPGGGRPGVGGARLKTSL